MPPPMTIPPNADPVALVDEPESRIYPPYRSPKTAGHSYGQNAVKPDKGTENHIELP